MCVPGALSQSGYCLWALDEVEECREAPLSQISDPRNKSDSVIFIATDLPLLLVGESAIHRHTSSAKPMATRSLAHSSRHSSTFFSAEGVLS